MAQAGYTPISLYYSTTSTQEPAAVDLVSGELAINIADGKLFYKNSGGNVRLLSIGYGSSTVTPTNGGVQYGTGTALALTAAGSSGQILRSNGAAAPTWADLSTLGVNTISFGTTGLTPNSATAGAVTVAGTLATTNGGTGLTSFTANGVVYASSSSVLTTGSALTFDGTNLGVGGAASYRIHGINNADAFGIVGMFENTSTGTSAQAAARVKAGTNTLTMGMNGSGVSGASAYIGADQATPLLFFTGNSYQYWQINNSEQMRLTSTGLGIGTSSPVGKLQVTGTNGSIRIQSGDDLEFTKNGANYISAKGGAAATLVFETGGAVERMRLDSSGNLGIGTSSPVSKLDVSGGSSTGGLTVSGSINTVRASSTVIDTGDGNRFLALGPNTSTAASMKFIVASSDASIYTTAATIDSSGNLGIGTSSPSGLGGSITTVDVSGAAGGGIRFQRTSATATNAYVAALSGEFRVASADTNPLTFYTNNTERARITSGGQFVLNSGATGNQLQFWDTGAVAERARIGIDGSNGLAFACGGTSANMTLTSGGDLLVGTTSAGGGYANALSTFQTTGSTRGAQILINDAGDNQWVQWLWNKGTSGNNLFVEFGTEASFTSRGSITYNRAGGLVAYNTTSDYRAKDIIGPVQNPGATIDALKVYEGVMKGATQSRPMLVAHEAQEHTPYAVTGEKDAVNDDGTPVFQQMDVSSLVPLLLAEIQSLRQRVATLEGTQP